MILSIDTNVTNSPVVWWENLFQSGEVAATSSAAGYPVTGLQNGYTTDPWQPSAMPATVTLTLASATYATGLCLAGHDMHTKGVTVILERLVGGSWVLVLSGAPQSNDPFILSFPPLEAAEWRVRFAGANTFRLAVMMLGRGLMFRGVIQPPHTPLHQASEVELIGGSESATGEFLQADFKRSGARASIDFGVQYPALVGGDRFQSFRNHFNRGKPFFIACFPRFNPRDVGYCWRNSGNLIPSYSDAVFMPVSLEVGVHVG
jgi:hypothetical protein